MGWGLVDGEVDQDLIPGEGVREGLARLGGYPPVDGQGGKGSGGGVQGLRFRGGKW